jgi:hypothetical protein
MPTRRPQTPLWVRALLVCAVVGPPAWYGAAWRDRAGNEERLSAVASAIAGRDVRVRCPGPIIRHFAWDTVEGSVRFDAQGRPADETRLQDFSCAQLDGLAEGREVGTQADVALAVNVLAHEAWHLAGIRDEAVAECRSLQTLAWTAERLGAPAGEGRRLARLYLATGHGSLPGRYRSGECRDGGALDLRPDEPAWP